MDHDETSSKTEASTAVPAGLMSPAIASAAAAMPGPVMLDVVGTDCAGWAA